LHDTPPRFGYEIGIGIELSHESGTATKKNKEIIFVRVLFSWEKTYLLRVIGSVVVIGFSFGLFGLGFLLANRIDVVIQRVE